MSQDTVPLMSILIGLIALGPDHDKAKPQLQYLAKIVQVLFIIK
jgi:hypothetical protein